MKSVNEVAKTLVIERLKAIPPNVKFIIGGQGGFTPGQLIEEVKKGSEVGKATIELHLNFIRRTPHLLDQA